MIELTEEYKAIAKEYRKVFGYGVPLSMIPPTAETEEKSKIALKMGKIVFFHTMEWKSRKGI